MKYYILAAAMALTATPALASEFTGIRAEATVGAEDVIHGVGREDITYGGAVGFDAEVYPKVTVGVEGSVDNVFEDHRDIGASVRVGYEVADNVLVYAKGGYANWENVTSKNLDGFRVGGGVDVAVIGPIYTGIEYRYSDFEDNAGKHGVFTKIGFRF